MLRFAWIIALALCVVGHADEATSVFRKIAVDATLQGRIANLAQDKDGVIWMATETGLLRYDGSRYRLYGRDQGFPTSTINSVVAHPAGGLWMGTPTGLARVQGGKATLMRTTWEGGIYVGWFGMEPSGRAWIPLDSSALYTDGDTLKVDPRPGPWKAPFYILWSHHRKQLLAFDSRQRLFARQSDGHWSLLQAFPELAGLSHVLLLEDGQGTLWTGEAQRLFALPLGASRFEDRSRLLPGTIRFHPTLQPQNGAIAFIAEQGVLVIRRDGGTEVIRPSTGLPAAVLETGMVDQEGSLWLAGLELYRRPPAGPFRSYGIPLGPHSQSVWSMVDDPTRDRLWIACGEGLAIRSQDRWSWVPGFQKKSPYLMFLGPDGTLWMGLIDQRIWRVRPGQSQPEPLGGPPIPDFTGFALAPDGTLCIARGMAGLWRQDPLRPATLTPWSSATIKDGPMVEGITFDTQGRLWAATRMGLACLADGRWQLFGPSDGLQLKSVGALHAVPDGTVWVTYHDAAGLSQVTLDQGRLRVLRHTVLGSGLPSEMIYALGHDNRGRLWVGTSRGPARWEGSRFQAFGLEDGLASLDINNGAIASDRSGGIFIGTDRGLTWAPAPGPFSTPERPEAVVTWMGDATREWDLTHERPESIPSRMASLHFDFGTRRLSHTERALFQVRLLGLNDTWRDAEGHRAQYPGLPPGSYTFQVRAALQPGFWGAAASQRFQVLPPWYRTFPAYAAGALLALAGLWAFFRWRHRRLLRAKARLTALVAERTADIEKARASLEEANEALQRQTITDTLTGLGNRRLLHLTLEEDISMAVRAYHDPLADPPPNADLVFLLVDLDHFKRVNDTYGHQVGDAVLRHVSQRLLQTVRDADAVIRWGGEEFLILARKTNRNHAPELSERLRLALSESPFPLEDGGFLPITASIGFAAFPLIPARPQHIHWEHTLALADECLYRVKHGGRNGWAGLLELRPADDHPIAVDLERILVEDRCVTAEGGPYLSRKL